MGKDPKTNILTIKKVFRVDFSEETVGVLLLYKKEDTTLSTNLYSPNIVKDTKNLKGGGETLE